MRPTRTTYAFIVLAVAVSAAAGYFVFAFLAPSGSVPPLRRPVSTELRSDVFSDARFRSLQRYVTLPITAPTVGWPNPFQPLEER